MTIESRRNELMSKNRTWGETVQTLPHTAQGPSPSPPRHHKPDTPPPPADLSGDNVRDHVEVGNLDHQDGDRARDDRQPNHCPFKDIPLHSVPSCTPTMTSTRGWSLDFLLETRPNFRNVYRVSANSPTLFDTIRDVFELRGCPLVIEGFHMLPRWPKEMFTLDHFADNVEGHDILVRNVHNRTDTKIPISEFIDKCRASGPYREENEQVRFYGKDSECPKTWENWLQTGDVIPRSLISNGPEDLFRYQPKSAPVETLMCYLGIGDTFTPCHKDLCASSGQNLMCYTENGGSSFWFMTESSDAPLAARYFQELGQELDHENYVITLQELEKAPFKLFVVEQKLGDLVLVPPRSCHQVVNFGGITIKSSWSRMTLKGLSTAYYHELPIYRRVCRPETYRVKSIIHHTLIGRVKELEKSFKPSSRGSAAKSVGSPADLVKDVKELLSLYDSILVEEYEPSHAELTSWPTSRPSSIEEDICSCCDFCGCDIFQSFFECSSSSDSCVVCPGCYAEGRKCKCKNGMMQPMQYRDFQELIKLRTSAVKVVAQYEERCGSSFESKLDLNLPGGQTAAVFRAACILYRSRAKSIKSTKQCSQFKGWQTSHKVDFPSALTCKQCHNARCFTHILVDFKMHSVEALLFHADDGTHAKYHANHQRSSRPGPQIQLDFERHQKQGTPPDPFLQLFNAASMYGDCNPAKMDSMELGWYDNRSQPAATDSDKVSTTSPSSDTMDIPSTRLEVQGVTPAVRDLLDEILKEVEIVPPSSRERKQQVYVHVPMAPYSTVRRRGTVTVGTRHLEAQQSTQEMPGSCKPSGGATPSFPTSAKTISGQPPTIQHTVFSEPRIFTQVPDRRQKDTNAIKMNLLPLARSLTPKEGAGQETTAKSALSSLRFKKRRREDILNEPDGGSLASSPSGDNTRATNSSEPSSSSEKSRSKEPPGEKLFPPPKPVESRSQGYGPPGHASNSIVDLASTILQEMGSMMMEGASPVVCNNPAWSNISESPLNRRPPPQHQHLYSTHYTQVYRRHQYYVPQRAQNFVPKRKNTQGFVPSEQRHSYPQHNNAANMVNTHPTYEKHPYFSSDPQYNNDTHRSYEKQAYSPNKHYHVRPPQPPPSNSNERHSTGWLPEATSRFDDEHSPKKRKHEPQSWGQGDYFTYNNKWHSTPQSRPPDLGDGRIPKTAKIERPSWSRHWDSVPQPRRNNFNDKHSVKQSAYEGQLSRKQTKRRLNSRWDVGPDQLRKTSHINPGRTQHHRIDHAHHQDLEQQTGAVIRTPLTPYTPAPESPAEKPSCDESGMPDRSQHQPLPAIERTPPAPASTPPPMPVDSHHMSPPPASPRNECNTGSRTPASDLSMDDDPSNWEYSYEQDDDELEQYTPPVAFRGRGVDEERRPSNEYDLTFNPWNASTA